jgi:hypothetical protein
LISFDSLNLGFLLILFTGLNPAVVHTDSFFFVLPSIYSIFLFKARDQIFWLQGQYAPQSVDPEYEQDVSGGGQHAPF